MNCGKYTRFRHYLINIVFYFSTIICRHYFFFLSINFNSNVDLEKKLYNNEIEKISIKNKDTKFKINIE
jgi:hypothetical protein